MKDDLLRRLRQKVVGTDNNGQSYPASRNIDGDEAADEIERLTAELAAAKIEIEKQRARVIKWVNAAMRNEEYDDDRR